MGKVKLPSEIDQEFEVTKRVKGPRFEHSYLGKVDLTKIHRIMAEKLVGTGHLVKKKKAQAQKKDAGKDTL